MPGFFRLELLGVKLFISSFRIDTYYDKHDQAH